jgi:hypothetical protein
LNFLAVAIIVKNIFAQYVKVFICMYIIASLVLQHLGPNIIQNTKKTSRREMFLTDIVDSKDQS